MNVSTDYFGKQAIQNREVEAARRAMADHEQAIERWFDLQLRAEKEQGPTAPAVRRFEHKYQLARQQYEAARYQYYRTRIKALAHAMERRAA